MFGECHAHIFMNGYHYLRAVKTHEKGPDEQVVRAHLKAYQVGTQSGAGIWDHLSDTWICNSSGRLLWESCG